MAVKPPSSHPATLAALGAVAFVTACVAHEAVGHGGVCLATGGRITLLTSVYFQCSLRGPLVAAAGPLMNLAAGALCWWVLRSRPPRSVAARGFLALAMAFNLLWGSGYFLYSAFTNEGDWAWVLRDLALEPRWAWRWGIGILGLILYDRSIEWAAARFPARLPLLLPYLTAGAVACLSALCFAGPTLPALRQAALESFGAGAGLLLLANRNRRLDPSKPPAAEIVPVRWGWIAAAVLITFLFLATLGHGFGPDGWI
jgi:hypothetical protein